MLFMLLARFTQNLQEEVLDMEFQQYAKGLSTISEEDFARILLRYTNLSEASVDEYLERVRDRIVEAKVGYACSVHSLDCNFTFCVFRTASHVL